MGLDRAPDRRWKVGLWLQVPHEGRQQACRGRPAWRPEAGIKPESQVSEPPGRRRLYSHRGNGRPSGLGRPRLPRGRFRTRMGRRHPHADIGSEAGGRRARTDVRGAVSTWGRRSRHGGGARGRWRRPAGRPFPKGPDQEALTARNPRSRPNWYLLHCTAIFISI